MEGALLLARVLLIAVFGVAALAKLADRRGARAAIEGFGVPGRLTGPVALLLPLVELTVAGALLLTPTARIGAVGALVLLAAFMAAIGLNLAQGRTPECHCFGQLHSAPAGPATLARNGALAAVAAVVAWEGPGAGAGTVSGWVGALDGSAWALLAGAAVVGIVLAGILRLLLQLIRQNGRILSAFDLLESRLRTVEERLGIDAPLLSEGVVPGGLAVGARAPGFALPSVDGGPTTLDTLLGERPVVLLFTDPACGPCTALLPDVSRWQHAYGARTTIVLVSRGSEEANRAKRTEFGVTNVVLQDDREVAEAYRVAGTPSAVLVRPDGTIGSPIVAGADGIRRLVDSLVERPGPSGNGRPAAPPPGLPIGEPAPATALTGLEGEPLELPRSAGVDTAVLFWNPGCGFCRQMLDDLKAWEAKPPRGAPALLLVSAGTPEANRAMGLRSPIALDDGFGLGRAFAAPGTPSAVLIDHEGKVASTVAVGASEVLALLRTRRREAVPA